MIKKKPARDRKYLNWVKTLNCCVTGMPADDPHHVKGHALGGTSTASDLFAMPMTRDIHTRFHSMGWKSFEKSHGSQIVFIAKTMGIAVKEGVKEAQEFYDEIDRFIFDEDKIEQMKSIIEWYHNHGEMIDV